MKPDETRPVWRNGITLTGMIPGIALLIAAFILMVMDVRQPHTQPYLGLFLYLIIPVLLVGCVALVAVGLLWEHGCRVRRGQPGLKVSLDFGVRQTVRRVLGWGVLVVLTLAFATVLGYRAYEFTESPLFCGAVCHEVMEPQYTTFQDSPHSSTTCCECHVGPGAPAFVRAKLEGLGEVYALARGTFQRPIPSPVENLRPARETCRECHWPEKAFGAVLRTWTRYLPDESNTAWTVKMLLNIGGGDPRHGRVKGIHWHMEGVNDIEYIATDERRLEIPWMQFTGQDGKIVVYQTTDKAKRLTEEQIATLPKRRMDCLDCHNRPTHAFLSPNDAVDLSLLTGKLNPAIPGLKRKASELLAGKYETAAAAAKAIADGLREAYGDRADLDAMVQEVQRIYSRNMFPAMNVRWDAYPNHIGHKVTPGCFRCHDGEHVDASGTAVRKECAICHTILAQGPDGGKESLVAGGLEFEHPEDIGEEWKTERCDSCHTGSP